MIIGQRVLKEFRGIAMYSPYTFYAWLWHIDTIFSEIGVATHFTPIGFMV